MTRKIVTLLIVTSLLAIILSACAPAAKPKVALMLARGGLGDKAFNDSANEGLQKAAQELSADVMTFDYQQDAQEQNVRAAAEAGYGLVIGLGSENSAAIATVAAEFPETRFAIVDATAEGANVTSVTFSELEGDFLAGALAALLSADGKVGYLGGADVTVIRRIQFGFEQGVKYVNPEAEIVVKYIAGKDDFSGFAKPDEAKSIAAQMYADGVSIVYAAAGGSTLGAIDAAKSANRLIVTTGSDQRWIAPDAVVTSRTKNMNQAVFQLIQSFVQGKLSADVIQQDYKSGGIGLAPVSEELATADILAQFEQIRSDLESGKIKLNPYTGN